MDTLFTSLIYSITIAFCLMMFYDFVNGLDRLTVIDNVVGYIEVRFVSVQPTEYTRLPQGYLRELVASIEQPLICPQIVDILPELKEIPVICSPVVNIPTEPDPWTTCVADVVNASERIAQKPNAPVQLLLPPAPPAPIAQIADRMSASSNVFHWDTNLTDYSKLSSADLRKLCSDRKIKWRNARGSDKHMTKAEMVAALNN